MGVTLDQKRRSRPGCGVRGGLGIVIEVIHFGDIPATGRRLYGLRKPLFDGVRNNPRHPDDEEKKPDD